MMNINRTEQSRDEQRLPIILASGSPRRQEILKQIGMEFTVYVSEIEEVITTDNPKEAVLNLAEQKGKVVMDKFQDALIISADTVVSIEGEILGKPQGETGAYQMLQRLSGRVHSVYTGVCIYKKEAGKIVAQKSFCEETKVEMYPLTNAEIKVYIEDGEPLDKAGAYGIQGKAAVFVKEIQGDYYNVVGLPVARLYQELKKI